MSAARRARESSPPRRAAREAGFDRWWSGLPGRRRDLLAAGLYAALTVVFFAPFLFSDLMLFGTDILPMGYGARKLYADFLREHHAMPLWNPYILGGLPFAEAFHGDIFYPASLLYLVAPVHRAIGLKLVLHVFVAGVAMYAYLRSLELRRSASFVGGLAYMFAPYFISLIYAGHDAKMYVTALFPLLPRALEKLDRGAGARSLAGGGLVVGLMLLSSHVQMAYFALWGAALYSGAILARRWRAGRASPGGRRGPALAFAARAALMVAVGLAVGLVQLLPSYVYTRTFSPRAGGVEYSYASSWSLHPEEVASLAVPQFGGYQDSYWGRNPFKLNTESPGPLALLLALWALQGLRAWPAAPALLIGALALLYGLGAHTPLHRLFYELVPGVKMFRAPSIIMFLFSWACATLAALAVSRLMGGGGAQGRAQPAAGGRRWLGLGAWAAAWAGFALLALLLRGGMLDAWCALFHPGIAPAARQAMQANAAAWLGGLLLAAGLLGAAWAALRYAPALGRGTTALALGALVCAGNWPVDRQFVKPVRLEEFIVRDEMVRAVEPDREAFRLLPNTGEQSYDLNYFPVFGVQTANGFHDNRMARYDTVLQHEGADPLRLLSLLNVKYFIMRGAPAQVPGLEAVTQSRRGTLYRNDGALPRAYWMGDYAWLEDGPALQELLHGDWPPPRVALAADTPPAARAGLPPPVPRAAAAAPWVAAAIERYTMRESRVRVRAPAAGLLVMTDNWYPAWRARVDGAPAPVLRANVSFRAVPVPAGDHVVEFTYHAPLLTACMTVSAAALLAGLVTASGLAGAALARWRRPAGEAA